MGAPAVSIEKSRFETKIVREDDRFHSTNGRTLYERSGQDPYIGMGGACSVRIPML
jgi:hypothetical protein